MLDGLIEVPVPYRPAGPHKPGQWHQSTGTIWLSPEHVAAFEAEMAQAADWYQKHVIPFETVNVGTRQWKQLPGGQLVFSDDPKGFWKPRNEVAAWRANQARLITLVEEHNQWIKTTNIF